MKVLGRIGGNEIVLDRGDGNSALTLVSEFPDPAGEIKSVQLEVAIDDYKPGDIFVSDGTRWTKVDLPTETVGAVTGTVYPRIGCDVQIRWADPVDNDPYVWKHTRLLRKFGSYPVDIYDGVVVTDSYIRDCYRYNAFHDLVPAGTEDQWYYRFFTFSEDGVWYTDDDCRFMPIELSWQTITNIVRSGNAGKVFQLGDTVTINNNSTDEFYKQLEFEVIRFDGMTMEDLNLTHSITFASVNVVGNPVRFDSPWKEYQITADQYVTSRTKVYYVIYNGEFVPVTNLRLGSRIPANTYYEKTISEDRTANGGNRWAKSTLRAWLNSTDPENKNEDMSPPLTVFDPEVVATIASVRNKTMYPLCDGNGAEIVLDKIYLLSQSETFNLHPGRVIFQPTEDTTPLEHYEITRDTERVAGKTYFIWNGDTWQSKFTPATDADFNEDGSFKEGVEYYETLLKEYWVLDEENPGSYRQCTEDDFDPGNTFKEGVTYYDRIKTTVEENQFCPQFRDKELNSRIKTDSEGVGREWWLRTANIETESTVKTVDIEGELTEAPVGESTRHLVLAFTIA